MVSNTLDKGAHLHIRQKPTIKCKKKENTLKH